MLALWLTDANACWVTTAFGASFKLNKMNIEAQNG